jgi:hypothetical protein
VQGLKYLVGTFSLLLAAVILALDAWRRRRRTRRLTLLTDSAIDV